MGRQRFSRKEYDLRAQLILERMKAEALPFDGPPEEKEERLMRAGQDRFYFFRTYLPHYFSMDGALFHRELCEYADMEGEPVFIAAPREHAKSTICTLGIPLHDILFGRKHFVVIVSDTVDLASDFSRFIQMELESN